MITSEDRRNGITDEESDGQWHIVPVNDLHAHQTSMDCACQPFESVDQNNVVIHNPWDEREKFERGIRKPS